MAMIFALIILAQSVQALPDPCDELQKAYDDAEKAKNAACDRNDPDYDKAKCIEAQNNLLQATWDLCAACPNADPCKLSPPPPSPPMPSPPMLSPPDPTPTPNPTPTPDPSTPPTTGQDPITTFHGRQMRYWLSAEHFTPVFEQGPLLLSQLAGPANPPPGLEEYKGAWVVATELNLAGLDKIRIETVDPTTLLAPPNATATTTAAADALTTMRLSFGGKQLAAGEHTLSVLDMPVSVTAARVDQKHKIGSGFVEEIHIKAPGLRLRISSSVANKFADEKLQVLGLHLDLDFLTFDQAKVRGALPEMWGLQPMTEATKLLLDQKTVDN